MIGIYKITNVLNDKSYIGQSVDIHRRWSEHIYIGTHDIERFKNNKFYCAIKKYGIENFSFDILEELKVSELDEREIYWIKYYDSFKNGYNSTLGGQEKHSSWYFNIDKIRDLWDEEYSLPEIMFLTGCSKKITLNCLKDYKNFNSLLCQKRTTERQKYRYFNVCNYPKYANLKMHLKPIYQYSLEGDYICSYRSIEQAAEAIGTKYPENIGSIFRDKVNHPRKMAYGFQWSLEKVDKMLPYQRENPSKKMIRCIETNEIFSSIKEASLWCGLKSKSNISKNCNGKAKSAGKHPLTKEPLHWEYV